MRPIFKVVACLLVSLVPTGVWAAIPAVELVDCTTINRVAVDEVVALELGGLDQNPDLVELTCSEGQTVAVKVAVGSQALVRDLQLAELPVEDRERFIGLNIVEMVEILHGRPEVVEEAPKSIGVTGDLYTLAPAFPAPDEPLLLEHRFGAYALAHHHLGWNAPFAGVAGAYELRTSEPYGLRTDLQLGFRTLGIDDRAESASATTLSAGVQTQWWVAQSIALGPGVRLGGLMAAREDTDAQTFAVWGGLTAGVTAYFPIFDRLEGTFGLEVGYSPWTYRIVAEGRELVDMKGLFSAAYFGVGY